MISSQYHKVTYAAPARDADRSDVNVGTPARLSSGATPLSMQCPPVSRAHKARSLLRSAVLFPVAGAAGSVTSVWVVGAHQLKEMCGRFTGDDLSQCLGDTSNFVSGSGLTSQFPLAEPLIRILVSGIIVGASLGVAAGLYRLDRAMTAETRAAQRSASDDITADDAAGDILLRDCNPV